MNNKRTKKINYEACLQNEIVRYKMKGYNVNDIIVKLSEKYDLHSTLRYLLGDKYRMKTIIYEKIIVIDDNNNRTDGIDMLKRIINEIS